MKNHGFVFSASAIFLAVLLALPLSARSEDRRQPGQKVELNRAQGSEGPIYVNHDPDKIIHGTLYIHNIGLKAVTPSWSVPGGDHIIGDSVKPTNAMLYSVEINPTGSISWVCEDKSDCNFEWYFLISEPK